MKAALLMVLPFVVVACEDGRKMGVINQCSAAVEAAVEESPTPSVLVWRTVEPGSASFLVMASDHAKGFFYWIRVPGAEQPAPVRVELSNLVKPESGAGFDRGLVIDGPLCPE